jgi:hypothetical protein
MVKIMNLTPPLTAIKPFLRYFHLKSLFQRSNFYIVTKCSRSYFDLIIGIKMSKFGAITFFFLMTLFTGQGWANQHFVTKVRNEIIGLGWDPAIAAELATAQEASFAIHEANGTLSLRLRPLAIYNNNDQLQELTVRHPGYLDFFLNLREPNKFADAFDAFSLSQEPREALLEALLVNPSLNGQRQFEHLVKKWGYALGTLADRPEFGTLVQELVWVGREGGTADFEAWVYDLLINTNPNEIEDVTILLALHANFLRREFEIAERWEVLERYIRQNSDLRDILLEHLGIWSQLSDDRLLNVINEQSSYFGHEKALNTLIFFLGYSQSLTDVSVPNSWDKPLRAEYTNWALNQLLSDPTSPAIEGAFHFRNDDSYWRFIMREGMVERLPCLLAQQGKEIEGLSKYFQHTVTQVDDECSSGDWVPGGSLYILGRKLVHGTPIESEDIVWASFDVIDAGITLASMGTAKVAVPAMKGSILALKVGQVTAKGPLQPKLRTTLASSVKNNILSANITRQEVSSKVPGLSRFLGLEPHSITNQLLSKHHEMGPLQKKLLEEIADEYASDWILENLFTTEFIRCAGIEALAATDPVCMTFFSRNSEQLVSGDKQ